MNWKCICSSGTYFTAIGKPNSTHLAGQWTPHTNCFDWAKQPSPINSYRLIYFFDQRLFARFKHKYEQTPEALLSVRHTNSYLYLLDFFYGSKQQTSNNHIANIYSRKVLIKMQIHCPKFAYSALSFSIPGNLLIRTSRVRVVPHSLSVHPSLIFF